MIPQRSKIEVEKIFLPNVSTHIVSILEMFSQIKVDPYRDTETKRS